MGRASNVSILGSALVFWSVCWVDSSLEQARSDPQHSDGEVDFDFMRGQVFLVQSCFNRAGYWQDKTRQIRFLLLNVRCPFDSIHRCLLRSKEQRRSLCCDRHPSAKVTLVSRPSHTDLSVAGSFRLNVSSLNENCPLGPHTA